MVNARGSCAGDLELKYQAGHSLWFIALRFNVLTSMQIAVLSWLYGAELVTRYTLRCKSTKVMKDLKKK